MFLHINWQINFFNLKNIFFSFLFFLNNNNNNKNNISNININKEKYTFNLY